MKLISLANVRRIGAGLVRPECVLTRANGDVYCSHFKGGVTRISPHGDQQNFLGQSEVQVATNGFAFLKPGAKAGDFLCANLLEPGGVWRISENGDQTPFVLEVDGCAIPSVNFIHVDAHERVWITISTQQVPRDKGYSPSVADGFIVLVDGSGARVVASDIGFTNEVKIHPGGDWLYVNETFARKTSRYKIRPDGELTNKETVSEYGHGTYPDGLEFDETGSFWITSIVSNRVIHVDPAGQQTVLVEEFDSEELEQIEQAYLAGELGRPQLDNISSKKLKSISSLAFGGPDLKTAYMGNLLDDCIYAFDSPVAGAKPAHWDW